MSIKRFGYVRVSSREQNVDRQVNEMLKQGITERDIYIDTQSGKDFNRPKYNALKEVLREGDVLFVKSLDRFGRNKELILKEWQEITKILKVDIVILDMPMLDTTKLKAISGLESLITDIVLQLLSFFAEEERTRIRERQREGIAIAKQKDILFGRPKAKYPTNWQQVYIEWRNKRITAVTAIKELNLKRTTFYKLVREYESK